MSFPAYDEYEDSHLGWLGKVPSHWTATKLKHLGQAKIGLTYSPADVIDEDDAKGILVLRSSNVQGGRIVYEDNVFVRTEVPENLRTQEGDILICSRNGSRALIGKNAMIDEDAVGLAFGAFMTIYRSDYSKYLYWVFNSQLFELQSASFLTATINQLTVGNLNSFDVLLPPLDEQKAITSFLDVETSKIDGLVSEQRRLIELLKEKRQAVISHAVTKGLNPNAPMKPSGIQWLGDVPEHWDVKPLRRFNCNVQTGPFGSQLHADEYISGGTPVVNPTHMINGGIVPSDEITVNDDVLERLPHQRLEVGDVIFSRRGELGRCALVSEREAGWLCGTGSMILRLHQAEYDGGYLSLFLSLDVLRQFFESFSIGSVMNSLSSETLLSMPLIVPPIDEQRQIVDFATERAMLIDKLQAEAERAIELLQERRNALISAAVTGKIDVRSFASKGKE
jgi:type I restriction enzyme S subunit